jgi:hypothetical protein
MDLSMEKGCGVRIVFENDERSAVEYSLKFNFSASNNQVEFKIWLVEIRITKEL